MALLQIRFGVAQPFSTALELAVKGFILPGRNVAVRGSLKAEGHN
jgi:hypothetical protein